jgi:hypothetical protein
MTKTDASPEKLEQAIAFENDLAMRAAEARGATDEIDKGLFLDLHSLLCEPIPEGFIKYVPKLEKGKPYESTGIRSVQVQVDRMNNIFTPLWWWFERHYSEEGKTCRVDVYVGNRGKEVSLPGLLQEVPEHGPAKPIEHSVGTTDEVLAHVTGYGGVDRGSSKGNVLKGSFTNAAKITFAYLGAGHEIYLGAADLEPDVNPEAVQDDAEGGDPIGSDASKELVDRAWKVPAAKTNLRRAASYAAGQDVGELGTKKAAVTALAVLTFSQSEKLDEWIAKKESA